MGKALLLQLAMNLRALGIDSLRTQEHHSMGSHVKADVTFSLAGGSQPVIIVPVSINGRGPFQFILDTGAGLSLLAPYMASRFGIVATEFHEARGAGGAVKIGLCRVASHQVGAAERTNLKLGITDELHRIGTRVGARVDGDLGFNFLSAFEATID